MELKVRRFHGSLLTDIGLRSAANSARWSLRILAWTTTCKRAMCKISVSQLRETGSTRKLGWGSESGCRWPVSSSGRGAERSLFGDLLHDFTGKPEGFG